MNKTMNKKRKTVESLTGRILRSENQDASSFISTKEIAKKIGLTYAGARRLLLANKIEPALELRRGKMKYAFFDKNVLETLEKAGYKPL